MEYSKYNISSGGLFPQSSDFWTKKRRFDVVTALHWAIPNSKSTCNRANAVDGGAVEIAKDTMVWNGVRHYSDISSEWNNFPNFMDKYCVRRSTQRTEHIGIVASCKFL